MPIGPLELGIVLVVVLLLFGARKLPELGRGLGGGMREFKDSVTGEDRGGSATGEEVPHLEAAESDQAGTRPAGAAEDLRTPG